MSTAAVVEEVEQGQSASNTTRWLLMGAVALAAVAAAVVASGVLVTHVTTDDAFVEVPMLYVAGQVPGRVVEILVAEHQYVEAGGPLVRLEAFEFELALAEAEAALSLARNRVLNAKAAAASADAERSAAQVEVWRSERELARVESMHAGGSSSESELDTARASLQATQARVRALELRAQAELALVNDDAQIRQAEAQLRSAQLDLDRSVIRAPFSGYVGRRNLQVGAVVNPGQPLLSLFSSDEVSVMANFKETQLAGVEVGSTARVTIDAFPDVVWRARVDSFSPATGAEYSLLSPEPAAGNFTKVVQRVPVKIVLDSVPLEGQAPSASGLSLAAGLSAEVSIALE
ncbi:MAG: HlyD family secretion protein [bacterium]|nr:HlyD family secretion protein [bacterium]